jgi:hypothetical protein
MLIGRILTAGKCLMRSSPLYRETRVPDAVFALICHTIQDLSNPLENWPSSASVAGEGGEDSFFGIEIG